MKNIKKADLYFILILIAIATVLLIVFSFIRNDTSDTVIIKVNGEIYGEYDLNTDLIIEINENGHNVLVIKDGLVYMESADCPNQLCVLQREIRSNLGVIACLPNNVIVSLDTKGFSEIDLVA